MRISTPFENVIKSSQFISSDAKDFRDFRDSIFHYLFTLMRVY